MNKILLKKLLHNKEFLHMLAEIANSIEPNVQITDIQGNTVFGLNGVESGIKYPVTVQSEVIGWVVGNDKTKLIASLLSYIAGKELEKKSLASETLNMYKEINLLYGSSEKIATCLNTPDISDAIIYEVDKLISTDNTYLFLLDEDLAVFRAANSNGFTLAPDYVLKFVKPLAMHVFGNGRAEIVNDIHTDPRFSVTNSDVRSTICVPLKAKEKPLGVLITCSTRQENYTARDMNLLVSLGSQAAVSIENAVLHEYKLKEERIKSYLERYVTKQVAEAIINSKGEISLDPAEKNISILFSDIRNFSKSFKQLNAEDIVSYLNEYFTQMVEIIFKHGGTVNKLVGDMIIAFFGAPSKQEDNEKRAIETAIDMQECLRTMPIPWIRENFATGIGINSGDVIVGNIGSLQHTDYTAIGNAVNVAARLESLAGGGQTLVSKIVFETTKPYFNFKTFGTVSIKGTNEKVDIFEVIS